MSFSIFALAVCHETGRRSAAVKAVLVDSLSSTSTCRGSAAAGPPRPPPHPSPHPGTSPFQKHSRPRPRRKPRRDTALSCPLFRLDVQLASRAPPRHPPRLYYNSVPRVEHLILCAPFCSLPAPLSCFFPLLSCLISVRVSCVSVCTPSISFPVVPLLSSFRALLSFFFYILSVLNSLCYVALLSFTLCLRLPSPCPVRLVCVCVCVCAILCVSVSVPDCVRLDLAQPPFSLSRACHLHHTYTTPHPPLPLSPSRLLRPLPCSFSVLAACASVRVCVCALIAARSAGFSLLRFCFPRLDVYRCTSACSVRE